MTFDQFLVLAGIGVIVLCAVAPFLTGDDKKQN